MSVIGMFSLYLGWIGSVYVIMWRRGWGSNELTADDILAVKNPWPSCVVAPVYEEFLFRCLPIGAAVYWWGSGSQEVWVANFAQALVFASGHKTNPVYLIFGPIPSIPAALALGAIMIWSVESFGPIGWVAGYTICVLWHICHNLACTIHAQDAIRSRLCFIKVVRSSPGAEFCPNVRRPPLWRRGRAGCAL